jgi:mannose-6-phosphate isomerase
LIDDNQIETFINTFFSNIAIEFQKEAKLSPKILIVAPQKRLSWQYHFRRAEVWKVILDTSIAIKVSDDDTEPDFTQNLTSGDWIQLAQGERHRLIGIDDWGIAEIWHHTLAL